MANYWNVFVNAFLAVFILSGCSISSFITHLNSDTQKEVDNPRSFYQANKVLPTDGYCLDGHIRSVYSNVAKKGIVAGAFSGLGECVKNALIYSPADKKFSPGKTPFMSVNEYYFSTDDGGDYFIIDDRSSSSEPKSSIHFKKDNVTVEILSLDGTIGAAQKVGHEIFFAGRFFKVQGDSRSNFAVYDLQTQALSPLEIPVDLFDGSGIVEHIKVTTDYIILDGFIEAVGSTTVNMGVVAVRRSDLVPRVLPFDPNWFVRAYEIDGDKFFLGGSQMQPDYSFKARLRLFNLSTDSYESWDPTLVGEKVSLLQMVNGQLVIAGQFYAYDGTFNGGIVKINPTTLVLGSYLTIEASSENPEVFTILGDYIYGGAGILYESRTGLLKVHLADLSVSELIEIPGMESGVSLTRMDVSSRGLVMLGSFSTVLKSLELPGILAYDFEADEPLEWKAPLLSFQRVNGDLVPYETVPYVTSLVGQGDWVYLGGRFNTVDGKPTSGLVSLHLGTGEVQTWDLGLDLESDFGIRNLSLHGGHLYVQGNFSAIQGYPVKGVVVLDIATRKLVPSFVGDIQTSAMTDLFGVVDGSLIASGRNWSHQGNNIEGVFGWSLQSQQFEQIFPFRFAGGLFKDSDFVYVNNGELCRGLLAQGSIENERCITLSATGGRVIGALPDSYIIAGFGFINRYSLVSASDLVIRLTQMEEPEE